VKKAQQNNVFDEMGVYWQQIADKGPTQRQIEFVKENVTKEGWVLDLACGTGRHSIPLMQEGYDIVGLDVSASLLKIAKHQKADLQLVRATMQHLPFKEKCFFAVFSLDNSIGYLPSEEDDFESLKELHKTLRRGALLVLDVFNREQLAQKYEKSLVKSQWLILPALLKHPNPVSRSLLLAIYKWKKYPSFFLLQKRTIDSKAGRLCDLWIVKDQTDGKMHTFRHTARLYSLSRLKDLLVEAGFMVERVCGGYEGQDFSVKSLRLIVLADAT
jgi:SAM-dependent methyltransferase